MKNIFTYIVIVALVGLIYFPSLSHMPRSDHLNYLADIATYQSLPDLIAHTYHLDQQRHFTVRSPYLFRPLLFIFLACEKYFFGYRFEWWQATGIILHLVVSFLMITILSRIKPGYGVTLFSVYFAVMFTNTEMVTWQHINGYMFAVMGELLILRVIYNVLQQKNLNQKQFLLLAAAQCIASFTFEVTNIFGLWMICFLFLFGPKDQNRKKAVFSLLIPLLLYVMCYLIIVQPAMPHFASINPNHNMTVVNMTLYSTTAVLWWIVSAFIVGGPYYYIPKHRLIVYFTSDFFSQLSYWSIWFSVLAAISVLILAVLWFANGRQKPKPIHQFQILIVGLIILFAVSIACVRLLPRSIKYLVDNFYYNYFFWAFFIILIYSFLANALDRKIVRLGLITIFSVLIILNAFFTFIINFTRANIFRESYWLVKRIEKKLAAHKHDPDFTLKEEDFKLGNYPVHWAPRTYGTTDADQNNEEKGTNYSFIELLYYPHIGVKK
ncbi:MAG: hypothetical protein K8S27_00715 [Candidatus Omnitrophica bacterium]|nr:hypothetical protein [Candidatus Omnitrophota bacterium]